MPPVGSTEWMRPKAASTAALPSTAAARAMRRSMRKASAAPHSIAVRMKPWASRTNTPKFSAKPIGIRVAAATRPGSSAAAGKSGLALLSTMRRSWAMEGRIAKQTAGAWSGGVSWKAWETMSKPTKTRIGARQASGSTRASSGM